MIRGKFVLINVRLIVYASQMIWSVSSGALYSFIHSITRSFIVFRSSSNTNKQYKHENSSNNRTVQAYSKAQRQTYSCPQAPLTYQ